MPRVLSHVSILSFVCLSALLFATPAEAGRKRGNGDGNGGGGGKHRQQNGQEAEEASEEAEATGPTAEGMYIGSAAMAPGLDIPGNAPTTWDVGTPLYLSAVFPQTLDQMAGNPGGGAQMSLRVYEVSDEYHNSALADYIWQVDDHTATAQKALVVEVWPADPTKAKDTALSSYFGDFLQKQGSGSHTYYVTMAATDPRDGGTTCSANPIPFATFTFTGPSNSAGFTSAVTTLRSTVVNASRMVKAAKTDSALGTAMMKAYTESGWPEKPLRAVITDADWDYSRDGWGNIIARSIHGDVAVDDGKGTCTVFSGIYDEDAIPGGKWTAAVMRSVLDDYPIACANVSK